MENPAECPVYPPATISQSGFFTDRSTLAGVLQSSSNQNKNFLILCFSLSPLFREKRTLKFIRL